MAEPTTPEREEAAAGDLERELELDDGKVLYVADNMGLADEAEGATTWDCGLVLAHYLIKQHEMGELSLRWVTATFAAGGEWHAPVAGRSMA
jgi:hypothetical protein